MKYKFLFLLVLCISSGELLGQQVFVSPQQQTTEDGFADAVESRLIKKVTLEANKYVIELPDGSVMSGEMSFMNEFETDREKRTVYLLNGGGLLAVIDDTDDLFDHVYVNLMGTPHKRTYTFWLTVGDRGDD